jgi:hypothetical protein
MPGGGFDRVSQAASPRGGARARAHHSRAALARLRAAAADEALAVLAARVAHQVRALFAAPTRIAARHNGCEFVVSRKSHISGHTPDACFQALGGQTLAFKLWVGQLHSTRLVGLGFRVYYIPPGAPSMAARELIVDARGLPVVDEPGAAYALRIPGATKRRLAR